MSPVVNGRGRVLVLDWGKGPILTHIASALGELGFEIVMQPRLGNNQEEILAVIEQHRPNLCVTRQRLYRNMEKVSHRLDEIECPRLIVDLGVWPHYGTYIADSRGENAASSVAGRLEWLERDREIRLRADCHAPDVAAMRATLREWAAVAEEGRGEFGLDLPESFSLLVLQREGDQVLVHDAPRQWRDPGEVARAAIKEAKHLGGFVVIKPHPQTALQMEIDPEGNHHRIVSGFKPGHSNDLQLAWLLARARNVITVNSTVHFQTLALEKPTTCLGSGWFTGNGVVLETDSLTEAYGNESVSPLAERYLRHLMSRQMAISRFAEPEALDRLMDWIQRCDTVGEAVARA